MTAPTTAAASTEPTWRTALLTPEAAPVSRGDAAERGESVSMALLVVLETLPLGVARRSPRVTATGTASPGGARPPGRQTR